MRVQVIPTSFQSESETLRGHFVVPKGKGPFPGICKFHGLPGSPNQVSGFANRLAEIGFVVLTFDFRGFRSSDGQWSLAGEVKDAYQAVSHLIASKYVTPGWVGVYGASYGGAVAVLTAVRDERIGAMCLRAPVYDTLEFALSPVFQAGLLELLQTAPEQMHGITDPNIRKRVIEQVIKESHPLNPMQAIATMSPRPLFIITGDADLSIPVEGVRRFYDLAPDPKKLVIVPGADHNLSTPQVYEETVKNVQEWFLSQISSL
jgi:dipeptidyl aminopeptidase/acylaminoacyl peptidase